MLLMFRSLRLWLGLWLGLLSRCFRSHRGLLLENLALRQQLVVFKRKRAKPRLSFLDKLFWMLARHSWPAWKRSLMVVTPETVARWHSAGFRMYWSLISKVRKQVGRKRIPKQVRDLIYRMVAENPEWGCSSHSWRAPHAWLRCFGANYLPLDETRAQRSRVGATLAVISSQPSRSHRRHGLLYRTHRHFQA